MITRVPAVSITLHRAEGFQHEITTVDCGGPNPWQEAQETLRRWARTAPDDGSYHKCDIAVHYADGERFSFRHDLTCNEQVDLGHELRSTLDWIIEQPVEDESFLTWFETIRDRYETGRTVRNAV